jgi:cell division protein FtsQ
MGRSTPTLAAALVGAILFAGLSYRGHGARAVEPLMAELDGLADAVGLHVNQISLRGYKFTSDRTIFETLRAEAAGSILSFDSEAARLRIEALPWIEHAIIERRLPDGLDVRVTERRPFARWSDGDRTAIIDATGRVLADVQKGAAPHLPHVAGSGAPRLASAFLAGLAEHPELARRVGASERVGNRRWRLHLVNGPIIELPADGEAEALDQLDSLQRSAAIFDLAQHVVDLRLAGRISVRGPALAAPAAIAEPVKPTARRKTASGA